MIIISNCERKDMPVMFEATQLSPVRNNLMKLGELQEHCKKEKHSHANVLMVNQHEDNMVRHHTSIWSSASAKNADNS